MAPGTEYYEQKKPSGAGGLLGLTNPISGIIGGVSLIAGLFGGSGSKDYDPSRRALKRFYELTDPNSGHFKKLRAFYGKTLADASPTADTLYGLAKTGGSGATSANSISLAQGRADSARKGEQITGMLQKDVMSSEAIASNYLGLEYQRAEFEKSSQGSFDDNLLGLGGSLLGKVGLA